MNRLRRWILPGLLLLAFALRVTYNTSPMPPVFAYPNELLKRDDTLKLAGNHFDHGISMPSFLYNTMFLAYIPARWAYGLGQARLGGLAPFKLDLMNYYLWVGRVLMALFGTLTVWVVWRLGRRLGSERAGLVAAAILTVLPIHVLGSRHTKEDIPLGLFCTVLLIFLAGMVERRRRRDWLGAGFVSGVCLGTKWLGGITLLPLVAAHWAAGKEELRIADCGLRIVPMRNAECGMRNAENPLPRLKWLGGALGMAVLGFFVTSPDYLLHLDDFWKGIQRGVRKPYEGHADGMRVSAMETAFTDYFRSGLWPGLTPVIVILAVGGVFWLWRRRPRTAAVIGGWLALFYVLLETAASRPYPHYQRYLQPIVPACAVLAALGLEGVLGLAESRLRTGTARKAAVAAVLALALAWPVHDTLRYLRQIPRNTILQCYEYINANLPARVPIVVDGFGPLLDAKKYRVLDYRERDRLTLDRFPAEPSYVLYSSMGLGRFLEHPDANPELTRFTHYVLGTGEVVKAWRPAFRSFYAESPTLLLLRFTNTSAPFVRGAEESRKPEAGNRKKADGIQDSGNPGNSE